MYGSACLFVYVWVHHTNPLFTRMHTNGLFVCRIVHPVNLLQALERLEHIGQHQIGRRVAGALYCVGMSVGMSVRNSMGREGELKREESEKEKRQVEGEKRERGRE